VTCSTPESPPRAAPLRAVRRTTEMHRSRTPGTSCWDPETRASEMKDRSESSSDSAVISDRRSNKQTLPFNALTLWVGRQKGHSDRKKLGVGLLVVTI